MDFTEVFTALETKIIDGADASGLANNVGLGLYDVVNHATYPGFHSMPSDHLACRKDAWDGLPEDIKRIVDTAMQKLAFQTALTFEVKNNEAAAKLREKGVVLHGLVGRGPQGLPCRRPKGVAGLDLEEPRDQGARRKPHQVPEETWSGGELNPDGRTWRAGESGPPAVVWRFPHAIDESALP